MSRSLVIAHAGDLGEPSGGTDRVGAIAAGLQSRGFEVALVVPDPDGDLPARFDTVEVVTVDAGGNSVVTAGRVAGRGRRLADERDATLQFEHSVLAGIATLRGTRGFVLDMHDLAYSRFDSVDTPLSGLAKRGVGWLERRALSRAAHTVVVSERMRDLLRKRWGVPVEDTTVVPNGYFPERIAHATGTPTEPGRVAFLGTLHPKLDADAFAAIAQLPAVSDLVVIGDGALRDRLESLAGRHGSLRVLGRLPDGEAFDLVASAEVAINPQTETALQRASSPVKLYYYAALGKPMVLSAGPSVVDYLDDNDAALVASSRSQFLDHVETVLSDERRASSLAAAARDAAEGFRWSRRVDAFETAIATTATGVYQA